MHVHYIIPDVGTYVQEETVFGKSESTGTLEADGYGEVTLVLKCGVLTIIPKRVLLPQRQV